MKFITQYKGLPGQIYVLFMARTINSLGFFIFPFLTLFLSARIGLAEDSIGKFLFAASLVYIPGAIAGGKIADRFNRKYCYVLSTLTANVIFLLCGFLDNSIMIPYLLIPAFFFSSIALTSSSAMMMDLTIPENRQESYSLVYLGMNIGIAIGPLVAGILFEKYTSWIFWGDAISGFVAVALVTALVQDTTPTHEDYARIAESGRHGEMAAQGPILKILFQKQILLVFVIFCAALSFVYAQTGFALPLQMSQYFGIGDGARYYGILMSVNGLVVVIFTPILVILTKAFNPIINLSMASICYMIGFGMYSISRNISSFIIFTVIWTIGEVISATNTSVYIANRTPISHRARLQSIYDIIQGLGRAAGPMAIGYFLLDFSVEKSWILAGILCFIAALSFLGLYYLESNTNQTQKINGAAQGDLTKNTYI